MPASVVHIHPSILTTINTLSLLSLYIMNSSNLDRTDTMAALRKTLAYHFSKFASCAAASASPRPLPPPCAHDETIGFLPSLQKRPIFRPALPPDRFQLPIGGLLVDRIRGFDSQHTSIDLLLRTPPPVPVPVPSLAEEDEIGVSMTDVRRLERALRIDRARMRLRAVGESYISHSKFIRICGEGCGSDRGAEVARSLDESGGVVIWGKVVFLRPEEVAKAIESLIPRPFTNAQREELSKMEKVKAEIDLNAAAQVRRELWFFLGLLMAQTAAFMRLTFWELSWDVMEPICFYVTSVCFMAGYAFFMRTSKEPSFQSFFDIRFTARQRRLMKASNFDISRFNELRRGQPAPRPHQELGLAPSHCEDH